MTNIQPAYVVGAVRTPTGKKGGGLARVHPADLGVTVSKEILKRAGLEPEQIDETIFGCATQTAEQGFNVGRTTTVLGLNPSIPASTVNMLCGSSAQGIRFATALAQSESDKPKIILAGGVENNHMVMQGQDLMPFSPSLTGSLGNLWKLIKMGPKVVTLSVPKNYTLHPMGKSGDAIAREYGFLRDSLDQFAFRSQMKAAYAMYNGRFDSETVSVQTKNGIVTHDEGIRPNTSMDALSKLKPAFGKDGMHTAGSSSQVSAGAAALLIANESALKEYDLKPIARIIASAVVGTDPRIPEQQLIGPIEAIRKVLDKAGLKISDIDLFEINEAFASVVLAAIKDLELDPEKVNVNGGAIALGHPLGTSGARLPVTLLHEMQRREKEGITAKKGLFALCIGGGQAIAIVLEKI